MNMNLRLHWPCSLRIRSALIWIRCHLTVRRAREMSPPICIADVSTHSGDWEQELFGDEAPPRVHVDLVSGDDAPPSVHVDLATPTSPPGTARVQQFIRNFLPATAPVTLMA